MKRTEAALTLMLAGTLLALLLLPACVPSSLSCGSSDAGPTPRPTGPVRADFYAGETKMSGKGRIRFTEASTGPVKEWSWDFDGDGVTDITGPSVTWYYNTNGYYTVTLTVDGWDGSQDTVTKDDYIYVFGCST